MFDVDFPPLKTLGLLLVVWILMKDLVFIRRSF